MVEELIVIPVLPPGSLFSHSLALFSLYREITWGNRPMSW